MFRIASIFVMVAMSIVGCGGVNTAAIDADGVRTTAQPSSMAQMNPESGLLTANFQGVAPTHLIQDGEGHWLTTPGIGAVVSFDPATNKIYTWSPGDVVIEGIEVTPQPIPGQPSFKASRLESNKSSVATVYAQQFTSAMDAIKDMTRAEAEAKVKQMEQARLITRDVADLLIQAVIPHFPAGG